MNEKLHQSLIQQKESTEQVNQQIPGRLGIPLDGQKRVEVSNRNAYVYVRLRSNQSEVIQAYNNQVAPAYDLPVLVQRAGGRYEVVGVDTASYENNWNSNAPFLPRHGNTHSFDPESGGGADVVWVYPRQFMPALVFPSGSVGAGNLVVSPYTLQNADGTWKYVGNTGTANITQHNPTSSTGAVMGLVYLDAPSGNPYLLINSGTIFSNTITGSSQIYPYIPTVTSPSTQIPLVAVRLITGTSQLSWDNLYDVRQFIHTSPTGSSGGGGGGIDTIGIAGMDEGVPIGTGTVLNATGAGVTFTRSGTVLNLDIPTSSSLEIQDDGVGEGTADTLNIIGSMADVSISGSIARISVEPEDGPQGFGYNYRIQATASAGALTVALKTMEGNDPSSSDKVIFRIANNRREVTSPLSFSLATGTNWFNAGSSSLADQTIDYFVYAVWNEAGGGVQLGIARVPYAKRLADLSSVSTDATYIGGVTYNTDHRCEVIGRFPAVLSASPGYAWTPPSSALFVINRPIYETSWLTWTPGFTGFSSNPTVTLAEYKITYDSFRIFYIQNALGTSNATTFTITGLPMAITSATVLHPTTCFGADNSANVTTPLRVDVSGTTITLHTTVNGGTTWTASGTKGVYSMDLGYKLV